MRDSVIRIHLVYMLFESTKQGMGVEVSHDDAVITEVKKKVKVWCEIGGTAAHKGDVNVMNVDGDLVDDGCNGEVFTVQ